MIRKGKETQNVEVIKDVLCNKCGRSCLVEKEFKEYSCAELEAHWGYFSDGRDGEVHHAHLCQKCWEGIVATFKHSDLIATDKF